MPKDRRVSHLRRGRPSSGCSPGSSGSWTVERIRPGHAVQVGSRQNLQNV